MAEILLIEDEDVLRRTISDTLERSGHSVRAFDSAEKGLESLEDGAPDLIVTDNRLPGMSGRELLDQVRESYEGVAVVLITAHGTIEDAVSTMKAGAVDFLAKPIDADQLTAALLETERPLPPPPDDPMSADRVRWEHIQRVFEQCNRNVSETARRLKMHRRTLQRILNKHAPRN